MTDLDRFLEMMAPKLKVADTALHSGDPAQRAEMWSHADPVTLFGAAVTSTGWNQVSATFDWLGTRFSNCSSFDYEVVAAGVSDELAYIVGIERTTASVDAALPSSYSLRVTTIFRKESGDWKVVHRHGDPYDESASGLVAQLGTPGSQ